MSEDHPSRPPVWKILLISVLLVIPPLVGFLFVSFSSGGLFAPPDEVRPWAVSRYEETFNPAKMTPLLTLAESPPPELEISWEEDHGEKELHVDYETPGNSEDNPFELFEADSEGRVVLPDGNELQLEALAIVLPEDTEWEKGRYPQIKTQWYHPFTGEKLPEAKWQDKVGVSHDQPRIYLRVKNSGKSPLRWLPPDLFDAATLVDITSSSSYSYSATHGMFHMGMNIRHQAAVDLAVDFAFGEPTAKKITLTKGSSVTFGEDAHFKLLEVFPKGHGSSSWGKSSNRVNTSFEPYPESSESTSKSLIFLAWPPNNHKLAEFLFEESEHGRLMSGNYGMVDMHFYRERPTGKTATIQRFPRLGRAVFHLPSLPRFPEVENLFEVPIGRTEIRYKSDFARSVAAPILGQSSISTSRFELDDSALPITFTNTTPIEMLQEFETLTGKRIYFDKENYRLTDERPESAFEKWWEDFLDLLNRWFP